MRWLERWLLGKEAVNISARAEERHQQAYRDFDNKRLDFYEIRGRLLDKVGESCRPVSVPDLEEGNGHHDGR